MTIARAYTQYVAEFEHSSEKLRLHKESASSTHVSVECGRRFLIPIDKIPEFIDTLKAIAKAGT